MSDYIRRVVDDELDELLPALPAVSLEGAKGVGKTETAVRRASTVYRLDDAAQRAIVEADSTLLLRGEPPILLDEWQRVPPSWDVVRRAVDADPAPGRFLLTGSATPTEPPTHSGAGRIVTLRMRPLTLAERGLASPTVSLSALLEETRPPIAGRTSVSLEDYTDEILSSGFPGLRRYSGRALRSQLDGYFQRIVDTDFEQMGRPVRKPQALRRWMEAYAAATATTAAFEAIRDAATRGHGDKPTRATTIPYRDVLERLWILDPVDAWQPTRNYFSRLSHPPKHHLVDPALAARLLGVGKDALLMGEAGDVGGPRRGELLGRLFESLVTLCVRVYAQAAEARVMHLRTKGGRQEVDLILERPDNRIVAAEVKLGSVVDDEDVKHLLWLQEKVGSEFLDALVIHTGPQAYRRKDGVAVVPAALLGP